MQSFELKRLAQEFLATRPSKRGQTVALGWFVFRVADESVPPELESLDFRAMASFTTDFTIAETIRTRQEQALQRFGVEAEGCSLTQSAVVSRSYAARGSRAFIERQAPSVDHDSGWFVGVIDDERSMNDPDSFDLRSLYELTIADDRLAPYWLLPVGTRLLIESGEEL